ncbi:MAG: hypothetical protein NTX24_04565 [Candidatus Pacearchaeota archaeon]|nr:hypothetical protein [Candidatus Pacearchaeota archaeon]
MPETKTPETREDRALRVAVAYAMATGARGISKENRKSKAPLGYILPDEMELSKHVHELTTNFKTTRIPLNYLAEEKTGYAHIDLFYDSENKKLDVLALDTDAFRRNDTDSQLNRTGILKRRSNNHTISLANLEARIDKEVERDPLFGKAVINEGDDRVLLEAIDAKNRAKGVYDSRFAHFGKKVLKSPHTYQTLAGLGLLALVSNQGQNVAEWWNTGIKTGFGKGFYNFMTQQPYLSSMVKITLAGIIGGGLGRGIGNIKSTYEKSRKEGIDSALGHMFSKVFDPKAVSADIETWAILSLLFPIGFGLSRIGGEYTSKLIDEVAKYASGHTVTGAKIVDMGFQLPVKGADGQMVQQAVKITVDSVVKSLWACFFFGRNLFKTKYMIQRHIEDSNGPVGALTRPFVEGYHLLEGLARSDEKGEFISQEAKRFGSYMKDIWNRTYKTPGKREAAKKGDGTLKDFWLISHSTTMSLPGSYQVLYSALLAPFLPLILSSYELMFGGKPKDIYERRVSPSTYRVLTGKSATAKT